MYEKSCRDAGYNSLKRRLNEQLYLELLEQDDPEDIGKEIFLISTLMPKEKQGFL